MTTFEKIMQEADTLTPDEQLRLAAHLVEKARQQYEPPRRSRKWSDIRGLAAPSLYGEDAQAWVTRTRREAAEQRERQLGREP